MGVRDRVQILVIGGGPGGCAAALRAAQLGARTVLVEKAEIGGTCLNRGCIPAKVWLHSAALGRRLRRAAELGDAARQVNVDVAKVLARKDQVVGDLRRSMEQRLLESGVQLVRGRASFAAPHRVVVEGVAQASEFEAENVVIATGSEPRWPPIEGIQTSGAVLADYALEIESIPASVAVIGGGAVGVEFATLYSALGSRVELFEIETQLLPGVDAELAGALAGALEGAGIAVHLRARIGRAQAEEGQTVLFWSSPGESEVGRGFERVVVAAGRVPATTGLNAGAVGVETREGWIASSERLQTAGRGIYAVGDVNGRFLLAHVAQAEGIVAAENAVGRGRVMSYRSIPLCVSSTPELASVGLSEEEARRQGHAVRVGRSSLLGNGRALAMGEADGFVKVVVDARYGEILGVHILGPGASEIVAAGVVAIMFEGTAIDWAGAAHPHPTVSEALLEAVRDAAGG